MRWYPTYTKFILTIIFIITLAWVGTTPATAQDGTSLHIPSIGVDAPIVHLPVRAQSHGVTWDTTQLRMAVGFLEMTQWFGQGGNTVLGGHSELARGQADIFWHLDALVAGDEIFVHADGHQRRYIVQNVFTVTQHDLNIIRPTVHEQLTLMTCDTGSFDTSNGQYNDRIVVVAVPG